MKMKMEFRSSLSLRDRVSVDTGNQVVLVRLTLPPQQEPCEACLPRAQHQA